MEPVFFVLAIMGCGDAGAAFMKSWDWSTQVERLIATITPYC